MAEIKFPYSQYQIPASTPYPAGQTLSRPVAVATITASNGEKFRCLVWLDTGADACVFPLALAIGLKLDVLTLPNNLTAGVGADSNVTYYDTVTVDIGQGVMFTTYAGFTEGMDAQGFGLLGQSGFFSLYDVHFSHKQGLFTIFS